MRIRILVLTVAAAFVLGGCIFGVSTSGNGDSGSDTASGADALDAMDATGGDGNGDGAAETGPADAGMDADALDARESIDGGDGGDGDGLPCRPRGNSGSSDAGTGDATGFRLDADAASALPPPELIYVNAGQSGSLGVVFTQNGFLETRELGVVGSTIRAIGPSLHYDRDGNREIPVVSEQSVGGSTDRFLMLVHLGDKWGQTTTVASNVNLTKQSRIGVADFDDDCHPDLVWADIATGGQGGSAGPVVRRVDSNSAGGSPESLAMPGAQPWAVLGSFDANPSDGYEELYWYDTDGKGKFLADDGSGSVQTAKERFSTVGTNSDGPGVGGPARVGFTSRTVFPIVDSSNNPVLFTAGQESPVRPLNEQGRAAKSPVATGDADADGDPEVVFVHRDERVLNYVEADVTDPSNSALKAVQETGDDVPAKPRPGVVDGTSNFYRRIDQKK